MKIKAEETALLFIDVQGRLHEIMHEREALDVHLERLLRCAQLMDLPILATEQIPEKLGPTSEPFKSFLDETTVIAKTTFSCCGSEALMEQLQSTTAKQVILCGIETHVCVYQTAVDLMEEGYEVVVAADAVSSRDPQHRQWALEAMRDAGALILPTESLLFALLKDAADPRFRDLLKLIK